MQGSNEQQFLKEDQNPSQQQFSITLDDFEKQLGTKKMPNCSEKYLIMLDHCLKLANQMNSNQDTEKLQFLLNFFGKLFDAFKICLQREDMLSKSLQDLIKDMDEALKMKSFEKMSSLFGLISPRIMPFNTFLFFDLLAKTEKAKEQIANKDILLLFGKTGSGKSTTLQYLGSNFAFFH